ncbi:hypothetical protein [Methylobacterium soli]|uniref:Uncharacterized protein n=1 Tax=Methylobacterium soli TaxID=553447 RepID=A0A6L3SU72_9HYPH|nr:hypothetical protein [Methylobacterium soli]KAB1073548.1 hypothetical protein F6X53_26970 [Methylobacterium soli]GJE44089.1 hypothetical protein AEGHOMDF_3275 [Methylobacterium soli]
MAESPPTTGELFKAKAITAEDLHAAVDAYMADRKAASFSIGDGYELDLVAVVKADRHASAVLRDKTASQGTRRMAVRTAILLARPKKR